MTKQGEDHGGGFNPHLDALIAAPPLTRDPYISGSRVGHFFVDADVQVVARLIGDEQADGDSAACGRLADVDLDLCLQHTELPQPAAVAHDHGSHRLLDLPRNAHHQNLPHIPRQC